MKLVLLDTSAIQRFIFSSNRLRENLGASFLVANVTTQWVFDLLPQPSNLLPQSPNGASSKRPLDGNRNIENDASMKAEVVYAAGGNAVILFREEDDATAFLRAMSKKVLVECPGLRLVAISADFAWLDKPSELYHAIQQGLSALQDEKRRLSLSEPLLGSAITRTCHSTGLPAIAFSPRIPGEEVYPVSREVLAKQNGRQSANNRLRQLLPPGDGFVYPTELEELGRSFGEFSYIGVVHIDGNAMGQRIREVGKHENNRAYVAAIRAFSERLDHAGLASLQATVSRLESCIDTESAILVDSSRCETRGGEIELTRKNDKVVLPIRPVIYGGDDVTFVCDGRIAIPLALGYMARFEHETATLPDENGKACSCAGVAIVKSHYPFARACDLASQLCSNAKSFVRNLGISSSAIDWHFANAGLAGDLDEIRNRECRTTEGWLNLRPLVVSEHQSGVRTWQTVQNGIDAFRGEQWAGRRSKLKMLRDALRLGPKATKSLCEKLLVSTQQQLPSLGLNDGEYRQTGWLNMSEQEMRCAYFDAIELADFQIPLLEEARKVSDETQEVVV